MKNSIDFLIRYSGVMKSQKDDKLKKKKKENTQVSFNFLKRAKQF